MNAAHLHLIVNHLPLVICALCPLILLWGWISKSEDIKKVGLALTLLLALSGAAAYLTGEPAEEMIEDRAGYSHELIHEHELASKFALIFSIVCGVGALGTLVLNKKKHPFAAKLFLLTTFLTLFTGTVLTRTAYLGGLIKHDEIRNEAPTPIE